MDSTPVTATLALCGMAFAALAYWSLARRPAPRASGDLQLHRITDDVWFYRGFFSNSAIFIFRSCVVIVDSQVSPNGARRLRAEIERLTPLPIRYVINTHHHGDHTGGNAVFSEAEIIGTDETARLAVERDQDRTRYADTFGLEFQEWHPTKPPTRVFRERLVLEIDGEPLELLQLGAGETADACIAHLPRRGVIASGDSVSTWDYPFLGTPFLDEGLHNDGAWPGLLDRIAALKARVLLPGHGPALTGEEKVASRLHLLAQLMRDLLAAVEPRVKKGLPVDTIVREVNEELAHYRHTAGLRERTLSQRFAIYRCINSLSPERRGLGWWNDLRPSVIIRPPKEEVADEFSRLTTSKLFYEAVSSFLIVGKRPLVVALLERWTASHSRDAVAWGLLSDVLFDGARGIKPTVDGTEFLAASGRAAKRALEIDAACKLALLNLGAFEVFGGMVLAQKMDTPIRRLEAALTSDSLTATQRRKGLFFLGKAHQIEGRLRESDRLYRLALPPLLRPAFPLLRERLRSYP